jgi:NADH dehydrogenase (ubiquinone) Fe-S protein 1
MHRLRTLSSFSAITSSTLRSQSSSSAIHRSLHTSQTVFNNEFTVTVNGKTFQVPSTFSVLQACEASGEVIPRFCYHERLSVAGNCRMCLVEVEKVPKPVASCAYPLMPNMVIHTNTPMVAKAREGVMEFLLANHPLDCPICDQGGECDLQDQAWVFGSDRSRFREFKKTVEDKYLGPLVKTVMTRCIACTRCIRYAKEVCGLPILGTTGRGVNTEVGTYVQHVLDSEISGNVIDLCPVGALTSKPFAFTARPWELSHTQSIDVLDAVGSAIRIDARGPDVMRILPRVHEDVNEEWIADKSRFSYDGLKRQRIDAPMVRQGDRFIPVMWAQALATVREQLSKVRSNELLAIAGNQADVEGMVALKDLFSRLGSNNLATTQNDIPFNASLRSNYLFNSTIVGIEDADVVLLVGANPRMEAAVLMARLRRRVRNDGLLVASVGPRMELNLPHKHLGEDVSVLQDLVSGKHSFSNKLKNAKKPMIILGMSALRDNVQKGVYDAVTSLREAYPSLVTSEWNGINTLHTAASRVGALDIGFVPPVSAPRASPKFVFLLGADDFDAKLIPDDAFVVYAGSHGDRGAERANVVLPSPAYTEKISTYVNMEGRPQRTDAAVSRLMNSRDDWQIIAALSEVCGVPLPYHNLSEIHERILTISPSFKYLEEIHTPSFSSPSFTSAIQSSAPQSSTTKFTPYFNNYYMTDPISRCSVIMARCSQQLTSTRNSYVSTPASTTHEESPSYGQVLLDQSPDENRAFALP